MVPATLPLKPSGSADVLVHFGHAPVDEQPQVIFEPWNVSFDVAVLENALPFLKGKTIGLVTTVQHASLIPAMKTFLRSKGITAIVAEGGGRTPIRGQVLGCSFAAARVSDTDGVLFVGTGTLSPHRYCNRYPVHA